MRLYMSTVVPSTCVTVRHASNPNSLPCVIADREMLDLHMCRWFSGRILTFHAVGPGLDFPGRCHRDIIQYNNSMDDADYISTLTLAKYV